MAIKTHQDIHIICRYLLPALHPLRWHILFSLTITGIIIGVDLLQPFCFKWLLDAATISLEYGWVVLILFVLFALALLRSVLSYWDIHVRTQVGESIANHYRQQLFEHTLHLPFAIFHDIKSGTIESRIMNDCGMIGRVYVATQLLPMIAHVVQALALVCLLLVLNWQVGLASILVFPLGWVIAQSMTLHNARHILEVKAQMERGQELLQEVFTGLSEVRATGNEAGERRRWEQWLQAYGREMCTATTLHQFLRVALGRLIDWLGFCIVFGWGGWQLLQHHLGVGTLLAMALYAQQLYGMLATILAGRVETNEVAVALQAIHEILAFPREWPEQGKDLKEVSHQLSFAHVSFAYSGQQAQIQHISFACQPGQMIGIVGPSGGGKSTLIQLCMHFYEPSTGAIFIDGQDMRAIAPHALRRQIGLVSQEPHLWNTTIRDNLLYGLQEEVS
ncbi:hypothetical protein KSF_007920 [Reticulibacter mediterranei]|uniref:ABC transmembrane type-1 domain-containing protein n=1 Tax=Reticulibacter mediterranei TaxID=2778369 RepID=A0A8J3MXA3_9CHLR|nr:hypothetical protein KSF_007920 [Reticulibacter mediterranei]